MELLNQKYISVAALARHWDMEIEDIFNLAMNNEVRASRLYFVRSKLKLEHGNQDGQFYSKRLIQLLKTIYPLNLYWQESTMFKPHIRVRPADITKFRFDDSGEYYLEINETKYPELIRTWDKPANPARKLPIRAIKILRSEVESLEVNESTNVKEDNRTPAKRLAYLRDWMNEAGQDVVVDLYKKEGQEGFWQELNNKDAKLFPLLSSRSWKKFYKACRDSGFLPTLHGGRIPKR